MKPDYKQISEFIRDSIDNEYLRDATGLQVNNEVEQFTGLRAVYLSEYGHEVDRSKNYQQTFASYLMGLPSCVSIPFNNYEILQRAVKWESLPTEYTEKQADKILENYWSFMAMQYGKAARKHGVNLFF